jgi:hypothetical protein
MGKMYRTCWAGICSFLVLTTGAIAQELDQWFLTRQECGPLSEMMDTVSYYNETPLFMGTGMTFSLDGVPFVGGSMFFVNQDSGTWTLLTLYADGNACMTAVGTEFEPYVD